MLTVELGGSTSVNFGKSVTDAEKEADTYKADREEERRAQRKADKKAKKESRKNKKRDEL